MARRVVFLLALLFVAQPVFALTIAPPAGHVNDRAGMFDAATVRLLESFLTDFERRESTQIVVLTVPDLAGQPIEDFSLAVAKQWGLGRKGKDNGVLLLIARDERSIRIEVGYGLEGRLTDLATGRIIRNVITPAFRQGNFNLGVTRGVEALALEVRGEYQADGRSSSRAALNINYGDALFVLCFGGPFLFFWFMLVIPVERRESKARATALATFIYAFVTFILAVLIFDSINWLVVGLMTAAGALCGFLTAFFNVPGRWMNRSNVYVAPTDGFSSGSGGFSGGGGGFSGGGGGFGGGGASGRW